MEANKAYLFASANRGKFVEVHEVAERFGVQLVSALDVSRGPKGAPPDVEESASTYEGNARLKADAYWRWSGVPSFADDAGLEVDALNGGPGVFSARYAGEPCDPKRNIEKLLEALRGCENRRARFRSVICLVESGREPLYTTADLPRKVWLLSKFAKKPYYEADFGEADALVFGSETKGLGAEFLAKFPAEQQLLIPMRNDKVRSLNLSNAVAVVLYEALKQVGRV